MATSRTGTSQWKRVRAKALRQAQAQGITHCPWPGCRAPLNYTQGLLPNSAEPDHIVPHANGGTDALSNLTVCCRRCNQSRGNKAKPKATTPSAYTKVPTSREW